MGYLPNILFVILFILSVGFFARNMRSVVHNIKLGRPVNRHDQPKKRWLHMARVALGQSKMVQKPLSGVLHIVVYVGFIVINVELLEIILDGFLGTHRLFAPYLGGFYNVLIFTFEIFRGSCYCRRFYFLDAPKFASNSTILESRNERMA